MIEKKRFLGLICTYLLFVTAACFGKNTDSLWSVFQNISRQDSERLKAIDKLSQRELKTLPDSALKLAKIQEKFSLSTKNLKWLAKSYSTQGKYFYNGEQYEKAIPYFMKSLKYALEINDKKQISGAYNNIGLAYFNLNEYSKALEYMLNNLRIKKELDDKKGISNAYNNLGLIYYNENNYPRALEYYFKSLSISEELKEKKLIADAYNNIGIVYQDESDFNQALDYFLKSLQIKEEFHDQHDLLGAYGNIGEVYFKQGHYAKGLEFYFKNLDLCKRLNDLQGIADGYHDIAQVYCALFTHAKTLSHSQLDSLKSFIPALNLRNANPFQYYPDSALSLLNKAIAINAELNNGQHLVTSIIELGKVFQLKRKFNEAISYFRKAVALAGELQSQKDFSEASNGLYQCYKATGQKEPALEWFEKYISSRDSILNTENLKLTYKQQLKYEYDKKDAILRLEDEKTNLQYTEQLKRQKIILFSVLGGLLLFVSFFIVLLNRFQITRKQKRIIEMQKQDAIQQKNLVEEKNREILDSIHYAKRIQEALLREEMYLGKTLPNHFILFKPKDIVSGDFYWTSQKDNYFYIAAADCTGHGVPGAFMSMLGVAFLNEINTSNIALTPAQILDQLGRKIISELRQTGEEGENKDGMDISLLRINMHTGDMDWSGANSSIYIIENGAIRDIRPDKQPIGYHVSLKSFTNHSLTIDKGSRIYLFTDGYADQFGGPLGKKLKYKAFERILMSTSTLSMENQKNELTIAFDNWKGKNEQVDDVCIIGIEV